MSSVKSQIQQLIKKYEPSSQLISDRLKLIARREMWQQEHGAAQSEIWDVKIRSLEKEDLQRFIWNNLILRDVQIEVVNGDKEEEEWLNSILSPLLNGAPLSASFGNKFGDLFSRPLKPLRFNLFEIERAFDKKYFQIRIWIGEPHRCSSYLL